VEERVRGGIKFVNQSNHELVYEVPAEQVRARIKYLNLSNHELVYDADMSPDSSLSEEESAEGGEFVGGGHHDVVPLAEIAEIGALRKEETRSWASATHDVRAPGLAGEEGERGRKVVAYVRVCVFVCVCLCVCVCVCVCSVLDSSGRAWTQGV
jgi:hypothetical protein